MENSIRSIMEYACETLAFEKMTFSKCRDAHILRATVMPFSRRRLCNRSPKDICRPPFRFQYGAARKKSPPT